MQPAAYWRHNKTWQKWLGREGTVVASTVVRVSPPAQASFTPYSYVIVDFGKERHEFMGVGHQTFTVGERVSCVLRKTSVTQPHELIEYGIKVDRVKLS